MGHGREEVSKEPLVKAHRAQNCAALPVKDWFRLGSQKGREGEMAYLSEDCKLPEEYDLAAELDLNDFEDANCEGTSVEEKIAELQQMIDACGDTDDLMGYPPQQQQQQIVKQDPASKLRGQCQELYEEVATLSKAKQEMEYELRQNVQKLQERIQSQYREKASLTERLLDAKQKFGTKQQEMVERHQEFQIKINAERDKKAQIQVELSASIAALTETHEKLSQQIAQGWEEQAVLVKELDALSFSQSYCHSELKEEREKSWRQHRDVMNNMARAGKAPPVTLSSVLNDSRSDASRSDNGNDYQPSIRSAWPFGMLRSVIGAPQQEKARDQLNQELQEQLESEKSSWDQEQHDLLEELKNLHWQTVYQASKIAECEQDLAVVQTNGATLAKHLQKLKDRPSPARSASRALSNDNNMEVGPPTSTIMASNSMPRANTEIGMALKNAEELRQSRCSIEEKRRECESLEQHYNQNHMQAVQEIESYTTALYDLQAENTRLRGEKEARIIEKSQYEEEEQRLVEVVQRIQTDLKEKIMIEDLTKQVNEKRGALRDLQDQNSTLEANVQAQQSCCFRSRPAPRPKAKAITGPSSFSAPPAQATMPSRQKDQSKSRGERVDRDTPARSASSTAAAPLSSGAGRPRVTLEAANSGAASSSDNPVVVGRASDSREQASSGARSSCSTAGVGAGASSSSDRAGTSSTDPQVPKREKKPPWHERQCFPVCMEGEEGWLNQPIPASEVIIDSQFSGQATRAACSISEAVEFLKANPHYCKEKEYYLVKEAAVWYCLFKHRAENKAHRMMDQYVSDDFIQEPSQSMGSGGRGAGREKSRQRSQSREHKDLHDEWLSSADGDVV